VQPSRGYTAYEITDPICWHSVDAANNKCYAGCASRPFKNKGLTQPGDCTPEIKRGYKETSHKTVQQCSDGATNLKYCTAPLYPVNVDQRVWGEAATEDVSALESATQWYCSHNEDAANHKCYQGCATRPYKNKGLAQPGRCPATYNKLTSSKWVEQCSDGATNLKYCTAPLYPVNVDQSVHGEAGAESVEEMKDMVEIVDAGTLGISFKDCGSNADAVVKSVTPPSMPLGGTTTITGTGQLNKDVTGASFAMKTTGVGGIKLLDCSADDASKPASCPLKAFGVTVGTISFNGVKFPLKAGAISGVPSMDVKLPASLPKFATGTTTTLTVTASSGEQVLCVAVTTKAEAAEVTPLAGH
jgi:hypothetical protein